jgi:hypothetical protein
MYRHLRLNHAGHLSVALTGANQTATSGVSQQERHFVLLDMTSDDPVRPIAEAAAHYETFS